MSMAQHSKKERIGFIGLGAMGAPMARKLLISGQRVLGYDIGEQPRTRFMESGGQLTRTPEELVRGSAVVFTSLPDTATFVDVAETRLLPHLRAGQILVDVGTVTPQQTRRFAKLFARKGASLLDAPVSGGTGAAETGTLRVFCGGDIETFKRVQPLLELIGQKEFVKYCGPSGSGQTVKGVNQLAMGLINAAVLEAISYGYNADIRPETLREALGGDEGWRGLLRKMCERIEKGEAGDVGVKVGQYRMFLDEARERRFTLPLTRSLALFLRSAEKTIREANRMSPSLWRELTHKLGVGHTSATRKSRSAGSKG